MLTPNGRWTVAFGLMFLGVGVALDFAYLIVIGGLLVAVVAAALFYLTRSPSLSARQLLTRSLISVGEASTSEITVTNTGARRNAAVAVSNEINGQRITLDVDPLAAGESTTATMLLPTDRRGVFPVGPLRIERTDPFAFTRAVTHLGSSPLLVVHPTIHQMPPLPTGHRRELEGTTSQVPQEGGISFHSLRDYELGDDLRLIHWRSVAKTGNLMVRKNIVTSEPRLMILLDTRAASYVNAGNDSFEDAARLAASLVQAGCNSRYPLLFRTTGGLLGDVTTAGEGRSAIMRILAEVQPADDDPGLSAILRYAPTSAGVSLGVVTGRPEPKAAGGISHVRSRFDMVTVIQVAESGLLPPLSIPGALVVNGENSEEVAALWRARFR